MTRTAQSDRVRPEASRPSPTEGPRGRGGFSLLELMVVLAVVALLMAIAAPSLVSLLPSRKSAAIELVGTLESARARAVSLGQEVHVAFADGDFPIESDRFRAYALFTAAPDAGMELGPAAAAAAGATGAAQALRQISPWYRLPGGLVFGRSRDFETVPEAPFRTLQDSSRRRSFPVTVRAGSVLPTRLPFLSFGPRGEIASPDFTEADALYLGVVEGGYDPASGGIRLNRTRPGRSGGTFAQGELVGLAYYTGRATVLTD